MLITETGPATGYNTTPQQYIIYTLYLPNRPADYRLSQLRYATFVDHSALGEGGGAYCIGYSFHLFLLRFGRYRYELKQIIFGKRVLKVQALCIIYVSFMYFYKYMQHLMLNSAW